MPMLWKKYKQTKQEHRNMTSEEMAELLKAAVQARPQVTQTLNFNAPVGQQIAHVDKIEARFDKDMEMQVANAGVIENDAQKEMPPQAQGKDHELTVFIHPSLDDDEGYRVEAEIVRLVKRNGIQEICNYLNSLYGKDKVLLPQSQKVAYEELVRLGMPKEKGGFDYKTFCKYYRK